jgi:hypothetical protein
MTLPLLVALSAFIVSGLNMLRGAGAQPLRYVIAAVCGLAGGLGACQPPALAAAQAVGVLVFLVQPWGRWYMLGRGPRNLAGPPSAYERVIERVGGGSDHVCWLISATVFVLPLAIVIGPAWLLLPILLVAAYEATARFAPRGYRIRAGEGLFGAALGAFSALPKLGASALVLLCLTACAKPRDPWAGYSRAAGEIMNGDRR